MSAKILTVDDSASIRLTTRVTLSNAGYPVLTGLQDIDLAFELCDLPDGGGINKSRA